MPVNLLDLDAHALTEYFGSLGEKPFRARQVLRWLHHFGADDVGQMTDVARSLREKLAAETAIAAPPLVSDKLSSDGTRKFLFSVGGDNAIETVFIPEDDRGTLCISSQAGCALDCGFCSTGKQGFNRNLTTAEIIGQLWMANRLLGAYPSLTPDPSPGLALHSSSVRAAQSMPCETPPSPREGRGEIRAARAASETRIISNVVMMGMGEPLTNFDNVVAALHLMLDDNAYGLSRRRVTVSTSGIVPAMDRLREACPVALAVSLHAPNDALRDELMPINRKYPLKELLAACNRYLDRAPRDFITFEYVMLDGVNDGDAHARELIDIAAQVPCKFNLIPFNPFPAADFKRSPAARIRRFSDILMEAGIITTTRKTRGDDIDAACGQLAGQVKDRTRRVIRLRNAEQSTKPEVMQ